MCKDLVQEMQWDGAGPAPSDADAELEEICNQLKVASSLLEKTAYQLANRQGGNDVAHLILSSQTIDRVLRRLCK